MLAVLEIVFRSIVFFGLLFFFTKWLRKKQLAQFQIFDYISGVVLGGIVAIHASTVDLSMIYGVVSLVIWFLITRLLEHVSLHSKTFRNFQNKTTPIIRNGKVLYKNMKKERYLYEELLADLRLNNIFDINQVEIALLENTGELSIKQRELPIKKDSHNLSLDSSIEPIIINGKILAYADDYCNDLETSLINKLKKQQLSVSKIIWANLERRTILKVTEASKDMPIHQLTKDQTIQQFKKLQNDLYLLNQLYTDEQLKQLYNDYVHIQNEAIKQLK